MNVANFKKEMKTKTKSKWYKKWQKMSLTGTSVDSAYSRKESMSVKMSH